MFPTSGHRMSQSTATILLRGLGFAYQLAKDTVLRGGAGLFYGIYVATNFQYAGPAFQKSATILLHWR